MAGPVGPIALGFGIFAVVVLLGLKWSGFGFVVGSKKTVVDDGKITAVQAGIENIETKLGSVEQRLSTVENDVERRATRDEVHQLELSFTRMEARVEAVDARTSAIAHGVSRIEGFMYEAALQMKRKD